MSVSCADAPRIDLAGECIWRDGERVGVPPRAFLVLRQLMQRPQQLVTKQELLDAVWPDAHVVDTVLAIAIAQLRQALGDDPKEARFIQTVHRRGYRWIGPSGGAAPSMPIAAAQDGEARPFVGRDDSLAELERAFVRAAARRRQIVFVTGEPGIGKTSVVDHFAERLRAHDQIRPCLLARGQSIEQYGAGDALRPIIEAVEELLHAGGAEMRALFRKHAPAWLLQMPELLAADEIDEIRRAVTAASSDRMQRELERALEAASTERTVVLFLEDLQWSDPPTVGLIAGLMARRAPARLLIVCTYRPIDAIAGQHPINRLKHELVSKDNAVELGLDGLGVEAVGAYLDGRYGRARLPADLPVQLHAHTSGNPLFLLNALADFERRGWLRQRDGEWECSADVATLANAVPDSTRALIGFRIDQLPQQSRDVLEAASISGMSFSTQAVAAATGRAAADVERDCEQLATALFLVNGDDVEWPDGTRSREQRFRHALYRQALSDRLTPLKRQELHRRIAERLERGFAERASEIAAPLSMHYEEAGDLARAVDFIEVRVRQAYARCAPHEAQALVAYGLALLQRVADSEGRQARLRHIALVHAIPSAAVRGEVKAEAKRIEAETRVLGESMPRSPEHIASLVALGPGLLFSGRLEECCAVGEQLIALANPHTPDRVTVSAHLFIGSALFYRAELLPALQHLEQALADLQARPIDAAPSLADDPTIPTLTMLGWALTASGDSERGRAAVESAVAHARSGEMPWYLGHALSGACTAAVFRRDAEDARRWAAELDTQATATGLELFERYARAVQWWGRARDTRDPGALDDLQVAAESLGAMEAVGVTFAFGLLADGCLAVGRPDQACAAVASALARRGEERFYDAELYRLHAAAVLASATPKLSKDSQRDQAERLLARAIETAAGQGARLFGLRATVDLCRLRLAAGRAEGVAHMLRIALAGFGEDDANDDLAAARQILSGL